MAAADTIDIKTQVGVNSVASIASAMTGTPHGRIFGEAAGTPFLVVTVNRKVTITSPRREQPSAMEQKFRRLADQWNRETRLLSSVNKKAMHPAYQQIIGMGREALPFLFWELERTRGHWLWALFAITGEDPAPEGSTFAEAVDAWLSWGRRHGYATSD